MRESLCFDIYYQKKINIRDYSLDGIEALARFKDENGNYLNTENSINYLKQQIGDQCFTYIVIKKIFSDIDSIPKDKIPNISINITASEVEDAYFKLWINNLFVNREWCIEKFEFEINEKCKIKNKERFLDGLIFLKSSGFKISLDDLGKDFNTIDMIYKYPFDKIKIDKSLLIKYKNKPKYLKTLFHKIHSLDMLVVVEGVEDKFTFEFVKNINCDIVQGFYFSMPEPFNKLYLC